MCSEFSDISTLKESSSDFRKCVAMAKVELDYYPNAQREYDEEVLEEGVYKHILKDYSASNLVTVSKMKQFATSWRGDSGNENDSEYKKLSDQLSKGDVDNTLNGITSMGLVDLWAPRLWSYIRRVDAVNRAKNVVQMFEVEETLHIDGRDDEVKDAIDSEPGNLKSENKKILPHVMLQECGLKAENVSLKKDAKGDEMKEIEKKFYECFKKYASGASRGITSNNEKVTGDTEEAKKRWKEKQKMATNDAAFENLTLAVITNYNSTLDYIDYRTSDNGEVNIVTLQDGLKDISQARDGYAATSQINYYTAQQLLNIVDTDAVDLQTEILKDLQTFDYSYFPAEDN